MIRWEHWIILIAMATSGFIGFSLVESAPAAEAVTSPSAVVAPASPAPAVIASPFGCNGIDDLNCDDFRAIGQNANTHLAACGDEDKLDRDGDGRACE